MKELNEEAEKLLLYFKGHRPVLNYLGIGLSETLWTHIHALPEANAEIIVEVELLEKYFHFRCFRCPGACQSAILPRSSHPRLP